MSSPSEPFEYSLNSSTIRGQELGIEKVIELAAEAGYKGIEPWINELDAFTDSGGSLEDLGKRIADAGLKVPNVIGFPKWSVEDDEERAAGIEEARRNLDMSQKIGAERLAAAPMGYQDKPGLNLDRAAERYRALLDVAQDYGVVPMLEFWGFSKSLYRFGEALYIASEAEHPDACILADVYHIYKGGGSHTSLRLAGAETFGLFHVNDYPADPPRETIADADRVYPGDGIAPLAEIFQTLHKIGYRGMLSLELFNESYWEQEASHVLETGLKKLREQVQAAFE
ncbi:MAG: sugar phosphate isomerase/epimerase family protein [Planctomycetota bacterium]|jgi:sugar phosphate isomerase/epimerase|nr:sugar phosphate isomerase/epimerase family protein [Planctomycetota bacterium]MDP7251315.1 sugar phosphate isomerase/epimerase family protein [Planctomycetota bacterium]